MTNLIPNFLLLFSVIQKFEQYVCQLFPKGFTKKSNFLKLRFEDNCLNLDL